MIRYHGTPITPTDVAITVLQSRHAMVSFANPDQVSLVAEVCQSFALDNGAFTMWRGGIKPDWAAYYDWLEQWGRHPGCDFAIIPDVIDGSEAENDALIDQWFGRFDYSLGVPVWHLHESLERLERLTRFPRIALGSSGEYAEIGTRKWWHRMGEAMELVCVDGVPRSKLHGLRMLDPTIFSHIPLSSGDSTNVARNTGLDQRWNGTYTPKSQKVRAIILAERIEIHAAAATWTGTMGQQQNFALIG